MVIRCCDCRHSSPDLTVLPSFELGASDTHSICERPLSVVGDGVPDAVRIFRVSMDSRMVHSCPCFEPRL